MIREMTIDEALEVIGGGPWDYVIGGAVGWVIGVIGDAIVNAVSNTPNVCTATGATKGGPICPPKR